MGIPPNQACWCPQKAPQLSLLGGPSPQELSLGEGPSGVPSPLGAQPVAGVFWHLPSRSWSRCSARPSLHLATRLARLFPSLFPLLRVPSGAGGGSGQDHGSLRLGLRPTAELSGTRGGGRNKARRSHSKSWCVTTCRGADSLSGFSGLPTKVFPEPGGLSRPQAFTSRSLTGTTRPGETPCPPLLPWLRGLGETPRTPLLPWLRAARCPGPCPPELTPVSPWVPTPTIADATRLGCPRASTPCLPQSLGDFRTFTQGDLPL